MYYIKGVKRITLNTCIITYKPKEKMFVQIALQCLHKNARESVNSSNKREVAVPRRQYYEIS